ncbi:MAG: hypothetical protein QOC71_1294 [Thermoplasmata archaeon]|nr:hypothetical protein [Thermoplasmata archaeon]
MASRPSLFETPKAALRGAADSSFGPAAQALVAAVFLAGAKAIVHRQGWEVLVAGVPILTALLGAVVFTLAIVLAGVLADFKEAERGLGEIVSQVRRLHWDFALTGADAVTVGELRANLAHFTEMVRENARHGFRWRLRDLHSPIDAMDRLLVERLKMPWPTTRTAQMGLGTLSRNVDRLEVIVETTFMRAGYTFAAAAIGVVLTCFLLAPLGNPIPAALLYGAISFVLVGLYVLVRDLDNPLAGSVRISTSQVDKLLAYLKARQAGAEPAPVVRTL